MLGMCLRLEAFRQVTAMPTKIRAQANQSPEGGVAIFIFNQETKGGESHRGTVAFSKKPTAVGAMMPHSVHIRNSEAQEIFDDLWNAGFRPSSGLKDEVPPSVLTAKNEHIADLRGLIHKCLDRSQLNS